MTPEGRIKAEVSKILKSHGDNVWYHMAVTNGMGAPTLDYTGCAYSLYFAVETKAPGGKPTPRQELTIAQMRAAGAKVFVIDGDYLALEAWLALVKMTREKLAGGK